MSYIVLNMSYGFGPFLRLTEMGLAINRVLSENKKPLLGIIVPWVYGEKQREVMRDHFKTSDTNATIFLDAKLGTFLKSIFYQTGRFKEFLQSWLERRHDVGRQCENHLKGNIELVNLDGQILPAVKRDIALELHRSALVAYRCAPGYCITFAHLSDVLHRASLESPGTFDVPSPVLLSAQEAFAEIESMSSLHLLSQPGPFAQNSPESSMRHVDIPFTADLPEPTGQLTEPGIYVTASGIENLERLFTAIPAWGTTIYSNRPDIVPGSLYASPSALHDPQIIAHIARPGWGSIWSSLLAGQPMIVLPYDSSDDPEIYFNIRAIERLGIGCTYAGQSLSSLREPLKAMKNNIRALRESIRSRFGTLNGSRFAAQQIIKRHWDGAVA